MTEEQRWSYAQKIVEAVATWQRQNGPVRDDARGRATIEAVMKSEQRRLVERGELPPDVVGLEVHWSTDHAGRSEPHFSFPPEPFSPETLAIRERILEEGARMQAEREEHYKTHCRLCGQRLP